MRNPSLRVYKPFVEAKVPFYHVALVRDEAVPYESPTVTISSPDDVARACADLRAADREHFVVLMLNTKNGLIGRTQVSQGSLNASIVHPREVFKPAIVANAASVVLVHNHPSGQPQPSGADIQLVRRLVKAGDTLGVEVLDSVVMPGGEGEPFSMRDAGLM